MFGYLSRWLLNLLAQTRRRYLKGLVLSPKRNGVLSTSPCPSRHPTQSVDRAGLRYSSLILIYGPLSCQESPVDRCQPLPAITKLDGLSSDIPQLGDTVQAAMG